MKQTEYTITRFFIENPEYEGFYVEVKETTDYLNDDEIIEFWICRKGYEIKKPLAVFSKKDAPKSKWGIMIDDMITDELLAEF